MAELGSADYTATLVLSDCQGDGSIKGTSKGSFALQNQMRYVCLVASLQIRQQNKERTMKEAEQV